METMGQQFRAARERKGITISRAAALTRIKVQHLEMMEMDDFSKMPAPTYAKGFIRMYAGFLGLDPAPLVQEYNDLHLNAVKEEPAPVVPRRVPAKAPAPATSPAPRQREARTERPVVPRRARPAMPSPGQITGALKAWLPAVQAWLPRIVVGGVLVLVIVLIGRCAARTASAPRETPAETPRIDPQAIMKEPPVRYLEIPVVKEETP